MFTVKLQLGILRLINVIIPVFSVPYVRDINYVKRTDIHTKIDAHLQEHRRVSLAGIGGIGYVSLLRPLS
jgi:hypothetical protein